MKREKIFGLQRNVFFTGITSFFTDTSTKMIYSVMPMFLMSMGASKSAISLIEGIAESTASLIKAFSGFWSDKIGRNKPFMIIGYGVTALITPLYSLVISPVQVLYYRFIERIGKGFRAAPRDSLISGSVGRNDAGRNFGFHKMMDNSGAIIGPLVAAAVLYFFPLDFKRIFWIATIPAILGVLTVVMFIKEARSVSGTVIDKRAFRKLPGRYYFFLVIVIVFTLGNSTDSLLLVKTIETGIKQSYVPLIYMIFNSVSVFFALPIGKLSDRIGREKLIIAGFLLYAVVYFLFGRFNNIYIFIGLFVMYGLYSALTDGSQRALISDIVKKDLRGTGYGIYHAVLGITLLPASYIAGKLYDKVNASVPFYFGGTMALLAAALMIFYFFRFKPRGN